MNLADRMKSYEEAARTTFPRRMPMIVRVDGKAFSKYTARLPDKPFNRDFISLMEGVAVALCVEIQGAQLAYSQSDEVSVLVHGYKKFESDVWYANQVQKIVSVSAAVAAATFTAKSWRLWCDKTPVEDRLGTGRCPSLDDIEPAYFDARAFVLPEAEVANYFIHRQQDAVRNSVQMWTRSLYSHKECHGKNVPSMKEMCAATGKPWEDLTPTIRKGRCVRKHYCPVSGERMGWKVDTDVPMFGEDRAYVEDLLALEPEGA
jgi:tRNA(His) 5'-end guanylyltransferase